MSNLFLNALLYRIHILTLSSAGDELWPRHVGRILLGRLRLALSLPVLAGWVPARGQRQVCGRGGHRGRGPQGREHRGGGLQVQLQLRGAGPGRGEQHPALSSRKHLVLVAVPGNVTSWS